MNHLMIINVLKKGDTRATIEYRFIDLRIHIVNAFDWFTLAMANALAPCLVL